VEVVHLILEQLSAVVRIGRWRQASSHAEKVGIGDVDWVGKKIRLVFFCLVLQLFFSVKIEYFWTSGQEDRDSKWNTLRSMWVVICNKTFL